LGRSSLAANIRDSRCNMERRGLTSRDEARLRLGGRSAGRVGPISSAGQRRGAGSMRTHRPRQRARSDHRRVVRLLPRPALAPMGSGPRSLLAGENHGALGTACSRPCLGALPTARDGNNRRRKYLRMPDRRRERRSRVDRNPRRGGVGARAGLTVPQAIGRPQRGRRPRALASSGERPLEDRSSCEPSTRRCELASKI